MTTKKTALIALRLRPELLAQVDAYAAELARREPGPRWSRSAALRRLVIEGLRATGRFEGPKESFG